MIFLLQSRGIDTPQRRKSGCVRFIGEGTARALAKLLADLARRETAFPQSGLFAILLLGELEYAGVRTLRVEW